MYLLCFIQGTKTKEAQPIPVGELAVTGADLTGQSFKRSIYTTTN